MTSRNPAAAGSLTSSGGLVEPFDSTSGARALLNFIGETNDPMLEIYSFDIARDLCGLPLALNQAGMVLVQRRISLCEFVTIYDKDNGILENVNRESLSYDHTLATVWEASIRRINKDSKALLGILAFMHSEINDSLMLECAVTEGSPALCFMKEKRGYALSFPAYDHYVSQFSRLLNAEEPLIRESLIQKNSNGVIRVYPLIQNAAISRMDPNDRENSLAFVVQTLCTLFPNTYSLDVGHQAASWSSCGQAMLHLRALILQCKRHGMIPEENAHFAELLLRASW